MNKLVTVLALSVATSSIAVAAAESTRRIVATFDSLDRNADHRLSRSEAGFDRTLSMIFADLDTDGDGFVTPIEYAALERVLSDDE